MWDTVRGVCAVGVFLLVLGPRAVHAWGDTGHRIICEIAFLELDRPARDEVKRLSRQDADFRTFSEACTWPDHPRTRATEHYLNVARTATDIHTDNCPQAAKCLFSAIHHDLRILADAQVNDRQRWEAVKYLGHWLGDLHQPLHVSYADDKGGNQIDEEGPCEYNLHAVWDTCLIEEGVGRDVHVVADQLRSEVTAAIRTQWTNSSLVEWANESYAITTMPKVAYCVRKEQACWYAEDNRDFQNNEPRRTVTVDETYVAMHAPTVKTQLLKAGVRLGHLLNQKLGNQ